MISVDEIKQIANEVVAENPDAINPRLEYGTGAIGNCLYTRSPDDDMPNVAQHCLGGEILLRLGLELPFEGKSVFAIETDSDNLKFEHSALDYLSIIQHEADIELPVGSTTYAAKTWSEALTRANERFEQSRS